MEPLHLLCLCLRSFAALWGGCIQTQVLCSPGEMLKLMPTRKGSTSEHSLLGIQCFQASWFSYKKKISERAIWGFPQLPVDAAIFCTSEKLRLWREVQEEVFAKGGKGFLPSPCLHAPLLVPKAAWVHSPSQGCSPSCFPLLTRNSPVSPCPHAWISMCCGQKTLVLRPQPKWRLGYCQSALQPRPCQRSQTPARRSTPLPRASGDRWCQPSQWGLTEPAEIRCCVFKGQVEHH